jgi:hypothetical protein
MSFVSLQTPLSPLKKTFEEITETFTLPNVLPSHIDTLKTLLVAQQNAHLAVVQALHQEVQVIHQEAQAIRQEAHDYVIRMLERSRAGTSTHVRLQLRTAVSTESFI